ncbi:3-deoxy-manno-octulosonate cytidylyltransferase [Pelagibacteraceae bacterium]|nr:3-deoxy-manno-octulosonate cytidylyltransferase [Pelagibacteraceae bacterium]
MTEIAIVIPSRLKAERLPNKPLELIRGKEMILHVYDSAIKSGVNNVFVATPDVQIKNVVERHGGRAILTQNSHKTGTDRIYEVFTNKLINKSEIIINVQGDMPNLNSSDIKQLIEHIKKGSCDIATLASDLNSEKEKNDPNICKVVTNKNINSSNSGIALDFYRKPQKSSNEFIFHHVGIYAFTSKALIRYVSLERSKLEIKRNLEQMRAMENEMKIEVCYISGCPLSVDTADDLKEIKKIMEK